LNRSADEQATDLERVEAIRRGDERAFAALFDEIQPGLRRIIRHYVDNPAVAEEVIQETWLGVIRGIFAFEGRSSLKTWIFRILINRAKTRAMREKRTVPFAEIGTQDPDDSDDSASQPGPGLEPLGGLQPSPEQALLAEETQRWLAAAIEELPPNLRVVLSLRDVEGLSAEEVCNTLGIRETNQRVLLHRARSRVRSRLAPYLQGRRGVR